jgi:hypothetical protein
MLKICRNGHAYSPEQWPNGKWKTCKSCKLRTYNLNKEKNPKAGSIKTINWQRKNPDKYNAKQRKWCQQNLGKMNAKTAKRNAAKLERTPAWLNDVHLKEIKELYIIASELSWLSEGGLTVDHIVPLQGDNVSGLHVPWNLQVLPASYNYSKGNKI